MQGPLPQGEGAIPTLNPHEAGTGHGCRYGQGHGLLAREDDLASRFEEPEHLAGRRLALQDRGLRDEPHEHK